MDELINKSFFLIYKNKKYSINDKVLFFNDNTYADMLYIKTLRNEPSFAPPNEFIKHAEDTRDIIQI